RPSHASSVTPRPSRHRADSTAHGSRLGRRFTLRCLAILAFLEACTGTTVRADSDPRMRLFDGRDGATCRYFNVGARIPWRHPTADWRDAKGKAQGDMPYAIANADSEHPGATVEWDVTKLVTHWGQGAMPTGGLLIGAVKGY